MMPRISNRYLRLLGIMITLLLVSVVGSSLLAQQPTNPKKEYLIRSGDVLEVFVWRENDLTRTVTVRTDGKISLPLVQDVQAEGLTPTELQQRIQDGLKTYISSPIVSVIVQPTENFVVYVQGDIANPGQYRFREPVTVLQALAMGGRFGDFAKLEEIVIIRGKGANARFFHFNYKEILKGKGLDQNIVLQNDDVVLVP